MLCYVRMFFSVRDAGFPGIHMSFCTPQIRGGRGFAGRLHLRKRTHGSLPYYGYADSDRLCAIIISERMQK